MRYIADSDGNLREVSFGAEIECEGRNCTEYTGAVPEGYESLVDWYGQEAERLYRWKIVSGDLALDADAQAPVEIDPVAEIEKRFDNYLPLTGGTLNGPAHFNTAKSETFGAGAGSISQEISNKRNGSTTPVLTGDFEGNRVYGLDFRNDAQTPALRLYAGEHYLEIGAWGAKFDDKPQGQTKLWSGELTTGSVTFETYGYTYDRYLVVGRMANGYPLVSVQCPTELLNNSQKWSLSDEAYYINFILTTGSIQIATNASETGSIVAVYGIN